MWKITLMRHCKWSSWSGRCRSCWLDSFCTQDTANWVNTMMIVVMIIQYFGPLLFSLKNSGPHIPLRKFSLTLSDQFGFENMLFTFEFNFFVSHKRNTVFSDQLGLRCAKLRLKIELSWEQADFGLSYAWCNLEF